MLKHRAQRPRATSRIEMVRTFRPRAYTKRLTLTHDAAASHTRRSSVTYGTQLRHTYLRTRQVCMSVNDLPPDHVLDRLLWHLNIDCNNGAVPITFPRDGLKPRLSPTTNKGQLHLTLPLV